MSVGVFVKGISLIGLFAVTAAASYFQFSDKPVVITLRPNATTSEIQHALNVLPASGGAVVLPPGIYDVTAPIILSHDHQTLRGSGKTTVLRLADNANCPVIVMGEPVNHPKNIVKDLHVANLVIDGNRRNQQTELWNISGEGHYIRNNGITVQSVSDSTIEHVTTSRCRSGGVVTTLGVENLTVRDLNSYDNQFDGLACYLTTHSTFADLFLHDNPGAGISLDLSFQNNVVSNALLAANDLGIFMRSSRGNKFEDVSIRNCHHFGVFMAHSERKTKNGWQATPNSECVNNSFRNISAMNCGGAAFRINNSTCTNNVIVEANFDKNLKGGLSLATPDLVTLQ
ncbi:MAG TPA: right-handed parallel beta-helix repeat-containing protein [Verrucomicrobiae bacterium]|nr:right-handed parallel beta-helix repeat-containing protein [Verrucomicrobiae bacterium]